MGYDVPETGPVPREAPLVGQVLDGRYKIIKLIGEGGMGEVYAAEHVHIDKKYAIKLLKPEIVSNQEAVTRFRQEARSSSSIGHRNIIAIEDFGSLSDGRIYMCMELLNGQPLNDMIMQPVPIDRLLNILIQTGHGLAAAHAKNIIHRDMKPENIFVTVGPQGEDVPKILDFGIAKVSGNDGQNHLTRTGTIFGTPFYMAPEQALGNPVDARTDIYAVGVIMYECFTGSLPFQGDSFMGILTQHITSEPEPVLQRAARQGRSLPPGLAEIITRAMAKNPQQRFNTMDELVNALVTLYRGIAGPGMSTYMEAFPVGHPPAPTPSPMGVMGTPHSATVAAVAPSGSQPMVMPMPSAAHSALQTPPAGMFQASPSQSTPFVAPAPKKSKLGLIIAVLAVLAIGGGVTAFLVLNKSDDKKEAKKEDGIGSGSDTGSGTKVAVNDPKSGSGEVKPHDGSAGIGTSIGSAANHVTPDPKDPTHDGSGTGSNTGSAGSASTTGTGSGSNVGSAHTIEPPKPKELEVLLMTKPALDAFEIWEDGKKVGTGPDNVKIEEGTQHTFILKATGFKDAKVVVDGSKPRIIAKLDHIPGQPHPLPPKPPKDPRDPRDPNNNKIPIPRSGKNCTTSILDPHDHRCVVQYCNLHENEPRCQAE